MNHLSLFSGGCDGFSVAAEWMGWTNVAHVEIDKWNQKLLRQNFPESEVYGDIREFNDRYAEKYSGVIEVLSGGFPCQDISTAGTGEGINGSRSGLWSEMFRTIRICRPPFAVIENSSKLIVRGLERVLYDLSSIGYTVEWQCLSNHIFGFPHQRDRIYIIAYTDSIGRESNIREQRTFRSVFKKWPSNQADGYSLSQRIHEIPESPTVRNGDGFRNWSHRTKALGNAVNPVVVYYLFNCIEVLTQSTA